MAHPTTLDILLTRMAAIEARLSALESHAPGGAAVTVACSELEAALAKLGIAIKQAGPRSHGASSGRRADSASSGRRTKFNA